MAAPTETSRWRSIALHALGGWVGGLAGGAFVVLVTLGLKAGMDFVAAQPAWLIIVIPLVGLALTTVVLYVIGRESGSSPSTPPWRTFPRGAIRSDITGDVVNTAGEEERFPWRLAADRTLAIFATVATGGAMGTEAPAAYLGVAAGACLGDRGRWWRRLLRPAALGGGAAGVAALMGIPLVGTAYILEIGRRHGAPISVERVLAAVIGGLVGWGIDVTFHLSLIRLVVPKEAPGSFLQALVTVLYIGTLSGGITALAGWAIYRAKKWKASPVVRLALGGLGFVATAITLALIASPRAASGPGGGAIVWAENTRVLPATLLVVSVLRAAATTAAAAAGGCGGVFVPFLAVGDIAGRVFAPGLGIGDDLAGSAGAAAGISGGYRLPFTAIFMLLGVGGPRLATLTGIATVGVAFVAAWAVDTILDRLKPLPAMGTPTPAH
jgi:H+/Cl- antiporter ClcA